MRRILGGRDGGGGGRAGSASSIYVHDVWWLVEVLLRVVELLIGHDGLVVLVLKETEVLSSPIQILPWLSQELRQFLNVRHDCKYCSYVARSG
jgi:hypothetical protein